MRHTTMIFYGFEPDVAMRLGAIERESRRAVLLRDSAAFWGESEPCDEVWVLPTVPKFRREKINAAFKTVRILELSEQELEAKLQPPSRVEQRASTVPSAAPESAAPSVDLSGMDTSDLTKLTNLELRALAAERGINVRNAHNKEELVRALQT